MRRGGGRRGEVRRRDGEGLGGQRGKGREERGANFFILAAKTLTRVSDAHSVNEQSNACIWDTLLSFYICIIKAPINEGQSLFESCRYWCAYNYRKLAITTV